MNYFLKLTALMVALTFLSACRFPYSGESGANSLERYTLAVESWQGANIDELLSAWPRSWLKGQTALADESVIYAFIWTEEIYRQAEQYYDHANNEWREKTPAGTELMICETSFTANPQGLITSVRPGGHYCGQMAPPPSRAQAGNG